MKPKLGVRETGSRPVRIIPAQFVNHYVKSNKNDANDAAAIAEAATRPTMRFVAVQVDLQALYRMRDQMVSTRTRLVSQMRTFSLECGGALHQGVGKFGGDFPRALADEHNDLTPTMRRLLGALFEDLQHLDPRLDEVAREIEAVAALYDRARRLMTVPTDANGRRMLLMRPKSRTCQAIPSVSA